ncbi:MAG: type II toxin-antitoxin system RelE/ParE family toxin [Wenzhouxiangella sp.]|nr:type II toxin-antitoxin system RelE/ParE family toxin [Wenzhouxiangella sp.]
MQWQVKFVSQFEAEFDDFEDDVQDELLAKAKLLERFGPELGRPHVDTLKASRHPNLKELRFTAGGGVWRAAFAFDPTRSAILLVAADKAGLNERRFYKRLIRIADERFDHHLKRGD